MECIYLDTMRLGRITEQINREKRIQRHYFEAEAAAGRLKEWQPPVKETPKSMLETVGLPSFTSSIASDSELSLGASLSRNMWTSNPGYVARDGARMASTAHQDFTYDEDEIEFMRAQGEFGRAHNKRRDEFVMYVEAAARAHHNLGGRDPAAKNAA